MNRLVSALLLVLCAVPASSAQKYFAPELRAQLIEPFVDDRTLMVIHIDPSRIDPEMLMDKIAAIGTLERRDAAQGVQHRREWLDPLRKAGIRDLYYVVRLPQTDPRWWERLVVVPHALGADTRAIHKALRASERWRETINPTVHQDMRSFRN